MGETAPEYLILPQVLGECESNEVKKPVMGLPGVLVVKTLPFTAMDRGSISGQGIEIPQAAWPYQRPGVGRKYSSFINFVFYLPSML